MLTKIVVESNFYFYMNNSYKDRNYCYNLYKIYHRKKMVLWLPKMNHNQLSIFSSINYYMKKHNKYNYNSVKK